MATLTQIQREVADLASIPTDERLPAARNLATRLDEVLTEEVSPETVRRCWLQLGRALTGRPVSVPADGDARAVALSLLGGGDPAEEVRAARAADERAQEQARRTRATLRAAVVEGHARGIGPSELSRLSGATRRAVNDWLGA